MTMTFRDTELARLAQSGWATNPAIRDILAETGLPMPVDHLAQVTDDDWWQHAQRTATALRDHFTAFRFGDGVGFGVLMVPAPERIDTRSRIPVEIRKHQHPDLGEDFLDPALGDGVDLTLPGISWTPFLSITGIHGVSAGSHADIHTADRRRFEVLGYDTRDAMTRQLWGARLLQSPTGTMPDSDHNDTWTFTLFPAEPLVDGKAVSGTVLKGRARFRLGKSTRGIGSARVAPAIPLGLRT